MPETEKKGSGTEQTVTSKLVCQPPKLQEAASYEEWKTELEFWSEMSGVKTQDQGPIIMMNIPNECKYGNGLRSSLMGSLKLVDVRVTGGLKKVMDHLDELLGKSTVSMLLEAWDDFMRYERGNGQSMRDFITGYEGAVRKLKEVGQDLQESSQTFIMLNKAKISFGEKSLVMTQLDLKKEDGLYRRVRALCLQSFEGLVESKENCTKIKDEGAFVCEEEDVLFTQGKKGFKNKKFTKKPTGSKKNRDNREEKNPGGRKKENAKNKYGFVMACNVCASKYHLFKDCPERGQDESVDCTTDNEAYLVSKDMGKDQDSYVFLADNIVETCQFTAEALNCAALDTCCTSSVVGETWLKVYMDALPEKVRGLVEGPFKGHKTFKFANMETLKSVATYRIPICPAGSIEMISIDVIPTDIPLLMSKKDMTKLEMIINLTTERARVKGQDVPLETTRAGHFILPLLRLEESFCLEEVLSVNLVGLSEKEKVKALKKLHLQFGHRPKDVFVKLLKNAKAWSHDMHDMIDKIIEQCEGCILRKRSPDRPNVCLPMASDFNQKVCIDLKKWEDGYILYMIDMYSRFTVAAFIKRKRPTDVVDKFMQNWVAIFGNPGAILNDNGGEFTGEEMREMKEALTAVDCTTAAEAPWQNGLCERNHAVVDNILLRISTDFPRLDIQTALAWACSAKNSLQQVYGFSPYQIVFGKNPRLPNILSDGPPAWEDKPVSETLAKHLNALKTTREEFVRSETSSRIKKALKSKVNTNVLDLKPGDMVYFKRDKEEFRGPAKVIVQDGKVIFVRDGSQVYRVSANRVAKVGDELVRNVSGAVEVELDSGDCTPKAMSTSNSSTKKVALKSVDCTTVDKAMPEKLEIIETRPSSDIERTCETQESKKRSATEIREKGDSPVTKSLKVCLKKNDLVEYNLDGKQVKCVVMGPAGKATGPNRNWYNVEEVDSSEKYSLDFGSVEFEVVNSDTEDCMLTIPDNVRNSEQCLQAKKQELKKLREFETYEEVDFQGQKLITTRWVYAMKVDGVKARLVARGFEETDDVISDSPTLTKTSVRSILAIGAMMEWTIETVDIKSAFLQGQKLEREVFVKPPKEAETKKVWKLLKCLYGLKDASRMWYNVVCTSLMELGCEKSEVDPACFIFKKNGKVKGVLGAHVDDFLYVGDSEFREEVMEKLMLRFSVGKHEVSHFVYTGFNIEQTSSGLVLDQNAYIEKLKIEPMLARRMKEKKEKLTSLELTHLRSYVGALNWVVRATRPDLSFDLIQLSTRFTDGRVEDLCKARKVVNALAQTDSKVVFPRLEKNSLRIVVYTDASYGNLNNGVDSMGANVVFLADKHGYCLPLDWAASKVKRVVNSTLAAETLALMDGINNAMFARSLLSDFLAVKEKGIPITAIVDNKSCFEAVYSTSLVSDKRLRREIAYIKQVLEREEVDEVRWVTGDKQLADVLTKGGASSLKLLTVIQRGRFD